MLLSFYMRKQERAGCIQGSYTRMTYPEVSERRTLQRSALDFICMTDFFGQFQHICCRIFIAVHQLCYTYWHRLTCQNTSKNLHFIIWKPYLINLIRTCVRMLRRRSIRTMKLRKQVLIRNVMAKIYERVT